MNDRAATELQENDESEKRRIAANLDAQSFYRPMTTGGLPDEAFWPDQEEEDEEEVRFQCDCMDWELTWSDAHTDCTRCK